MQKDEPFVTNFYIEQQIKILKPHPIAIKLTADILQNYYQLQAKESIKNLQSQLLTIYQFFQLDQFEGQQEINNKINNLLDEFLKIDGDSIKISFRRSVPRKSLAKSFKLLSLKLRISFDVISKIWINKQTFPNQLRWACQCIKNIQNQLNQDANRVAKTNQNCLSAEFVNNKCSPLI